MNALSEGLGVDAIELFKVASGKKAVFNHADSWPSHTLVKLLEAVVSNPELTRAVKILITMKPAKLKDLLKQLEKD